LIELDQRNRPADMQGSGQRTNRINRNHQQRDIAGEARPG
jgi:hypothetical protein